MLFIDSIQKLGQRILLFIISLGFSLIPTYAADVATTSAQPLKLDLAIKMAQQNDPWLVGNQHKQNSLRSLSVAANTLPDPKISLAYANIPVDSFNFGQDPMSQIKVGISQVFPRGDSLAIKQRQLELKSSEYPYLRQDRKAKVKVTVAQLWLDAFKAQESIALIESSRELFEQLADVAEARYSSAVGKTRQQDIVRAQLELTRLEDRLTMLNQQLEISTQRLGQWLSSYFLQSSDASMGQVENTEPSVYQKIVIASELPETLLLNPKLHGDQNNIRPEKLFRYFSNHPSVVAIDQKIKVAKSSIDLSKQKYKPEWAVNASYGHRNDGPMGIERNDLFSVGVTFDMPFFTAKRQDKDLQSAISTTESIKSEKWLLLRNLFIEFESAKARLNRTNERQRLYQSKLLVQIHEQAEASLTAYTNDDGDFAEVVRARIAVLNAEIDALAINVEKQKYIIQSNYYFETTSDINIALDSTSGER